MSTQPTKEEITYFATTNFRNRATPFGIKRKDRRAHMYILGKTGTGKSTLLETLIRQDLLHGHGFALLDPHGDLVNKVLAEAPESRRNDLIYFDATDSAHPLGFNPLESVAEQYRPLAASGLLSVFQHLWADSWGPRLEHILRNTILALLEQPTATLADIPRLLDDVTYRKQVVNRLTNEQARNFWLKEYAGYPARFRAEAIAPLQNKVGAFLANPLIHRIVAQKQSAFRLRRVMDAGKVLLVNLSKGKIGADTATLLGALIVSRMGLAALSRADSPEEKRRDFYLYLDEFHNFTTLALVGMLSELRKYRLNLILAHQYLAQLDERLLAAILGNVGTVISFRIGPTDAETIAQEFFPEFSTADLLNLPNYNVYLKLMIDGRVSSPFSAETLPPPHNNQSL
ncbi:MAG TPA: type IV secretion system DNA-binding domain-containing protein [Pyrinomonadaceae bacterium]|nr:type IV secretion system DNA-binding domain-containing protein [Pyrinomonadaceae bacterium]